MGEWHTRSMNHESRIMNYGIKNYAFFFIFSFLFFPFFSFAQSVALKSAKTSYEVGEGFPVSLSIDTDGKSINTISGTIRAPADIFQMFDLRYGNSIVSLWVEKPAINASEGTITFTGGVPGGFNGMGGPILNFALKAKKTGGATISLEQVIVLLNDGLGTELKDVALKPISVTIVPAAPKKIVPPTEKKEEPLKQEIPAEEEQLLLLPDRDAPEEFVPIVSRDPSVAGNKYFVSFFAVDKDTGVSFYEVEERPKVISWFTSVFTKPWTRAESPYVLRTQWWPTTVVVRAHDQAGNFAEHAAGKPTHPVLLFIFTGMLIVAIIWRNRFYFISKKKRHGKHS